MASSVLEVICADNFDISVSRNREINTLGIFAFKTISRGRSVEVSDLIPSSYRVP